LSSACDESAGLDTEVVEGVKQAYQRALLEELYVVHNRRERVHPDPLETLYAFSDVRDREIAGLIAAGLAFGGVGQILKSIDAVLHRMEHRPSAFLDMSTRMSLKRAFRGFRHRWVDGDDMVGLLWAVRETVREYGSLEEALRIGQPESANTVMPHLIQFVERLRACGGLGVSPLLSDPSGGSACKRHQLYLRWMIRQDAVDPGGWSVIPPSKLVVPLDTHMHRIAREMKLTHRKQANLITALEITAAFKRLCPEDPVRYDFVLTRFGIRKDSTRETFVDKYRAES